MNLGHESILCIYLLQEYRTQLSICMYVWQLDSVNKHSSLLDIMLKTKSPEKLFEKIYHQFRYLQKLKEESGTVPRCILT